MPEASEVTQLIVIGSSAGGVDALTTLVSTLPAGFPAPIVIAQHLDPRRPSHLAEILARSSPMQVRTVASDTPLRNGTIYVVPSNQDVEITDDHVRLRRSRPGDSKPSIDLLFLSAAQAYGERLIAVILTGFGSDGANGARYVAEAGGTVVIQNPQTAEYPSMPQSLDPGTVDVVADLEQIGSVLSNLLQSTDGQHSPEEDGALRNLLDQLRDREGIDFSAYRMPTIMRRLHRRMIATGHDQIPEYARYLRSHAQEHRHLVNSFLIKVTNFFRDPELYHYLQERVLPELIEGARARGSELRFWSAGCATGEEAYSLAILIAEAMGDHLGELNVRLFATDVDEEAIAFARRGIYSASALQDVSEHLRRRYFNFVEGEYEVRKFLRNVVIFGQHDLAQRAPFPHINLIFCRNVLIYFTPELQRRALQLFAFALHDGARLVLGKSETTTPLSEYFVTEDPRLKVYRRIGEAVLIPPVRLPQNPPLPRLQPVVERHAATGPGHVRMPGQDFQQTSTVPESERLILALPAGLVTVNRRYDIQTINGAGRRLFGVYGSAIGEDFLHLIQAVPSSEIRPIIDGVLRDGRPNIGQIIQARIPAGELRQLHVSCFAISLPGDTRQMNGAVLLATDVTEIITEGQRLEQEEARQRQIAAQLGDQIKKLTESNQQLLEANTELSNVNLSLRSTNEELLVASEEAQASAEEIETLNEELQATNEELETLNEELQSTVEELNTTNDDMQAKSIELMSLAESLKEQRRESESERARLEAVLTGMSDAVVVIDASGQTVLSNSAYQRFFEGSGLIPEDEAGQPLSADLTPQQRAARGENFSMEFCVSGSAGERRWYEANGQPIEHDGERHGLVVIRDISERSLRRLEEQFIAMASHELRTPLTPLQGCIEMLTRLLADRQANDPARSYAELALEETRQFTRRVDDLMDATRLQTDSFRIERQPVILGPLLERAAAFAKMGAEGRTIDVSLPDEPVIVEGDASRLEQVLINLLANAIKHASESLRIDLRLRRDGNNARIEVQDYGTGISSEDLPQIFTRFYQVERGGRLGSGLGLGLFICRQVVEAHGGSIAVDSTPGDGATFTVSLPLAATE